MRKEINKLNTANKVFPKLVVVENHSNHVHIEIEIENHVKSIRTLIRKLNPIDRQKYFNGLLDHILNKEIQYPAVNNSKQKINTNSDNFSEMSVDDLELIRELSCKLQDLYVKTGDPLE